MKTTLTTSVRFRTLYEAVTCIKLATDFVISQVKTRVRSALQMQDESCDVGNQVLYRHQTIIAIRCFHNVLELAGIQNSYLQSRYSKFRTAVCQGYGDGTN